MSAALDQSGRKRGEAGSDLDDVITRMRRDRIQDTRDVVRIGKKILAEPPSRRVTFHASIVQQPRDVGRAASPLLRHWL
jgi:hypothetical protein